MLEAQKDSYEDSKFKRRLDRRSNRQNQQDKVVKRQIPQNIP